jgi:hypothetical protein
LVASLHPLGEKHQNRLGRPESQPSATLSTIVDTQGLRWVLAKEQIIISGEPTEIDEAVFNGNSRNSGLLRVAASQGFLHHT